VAFKRRHGDDVSIVPSVQLHAPADRSAMSHPVGSCNRPRPSQLESKPTLFFLNDAHAPGGAETYQTHLAAECSKRGITVRLCMPNHPSLDPWARELRRSGAAVSQGLSLFGWMINLARHSRNRNAIVHLNGSWNGSFSLHLAAAKMLGMSVVITEHSIPVVPTPGAGLRRLAPWRIKHQIRRLRKHIQWLWADQIIVVSRSERERLTKDYGLPKSQCVAIPNGVDCEVFRPDLQAGRKIREKLGIGEQLVVGSVGRLDDKKGYHLLIQAAAALKHTDITVLLVGDGPQRDRLAQQAWELEIEDKVHLPGWRDDVPSFLNAMDIFALPSEAEALPFSILEAMSAGIPVVATDVGGVRELVRDRITGYIIPRGNIEQLITRLRELIEFPQLREAIGRKGREHVKTHYSQEAMLDKTLAIYEQILSHRR